MADIIHLFLASILIIFFIMAFFRWRENRMSQYAANAQNTLSEIEFELSWMDSCEVYGRPVDQSRRMKLLEERAFLESIINEDNR